MAPQRAGATEVVAELPVGGRPAETARRGKRRACVEMDAYRWVADR